MRPHHQATCLENPPEPCLCGDMDGELASWGSIRLAGSKRARGRAFIKAQLGVDTARLAPRAPTRRQHRTRPNQTPSERSPITRRPRHLGEAIARARAAGRGAAPLLYHGASATGKGVVAAFRESRGARSRGIREKREPGRGREAATDRAPRCCYCHGELPRLGGSRIEAREERRAPWAAPRYHHFLICLALLLASYQ